MTKEIPLTRGLVAIVDDEDFERLSAFRWNAVRGRRGSFYASRSVRPEEGLGVRTRQMQRDVLDPKGEVPGSTLADHIDGNTLDCRRCNLRWASHSVSGLNRRLFVTNATGFRGVHFCNRSQRFIAMIRSQGRLRWIGSFVDAHEAARAYDRSAIEHHGEHARPNFPEAGA